MQASRSCPTVATTPEAVKAAFIKEGDLFKEKGVLFLDTFVNLSKPDLFERQMYEEFKDILGLVAGREQARHGGGLSARSITSTTSPCAARRAKCWSNWSAKTGSAWCCWAVRITTTPA